MLHISIIGLYRDVANNSRSNSFGTPQNRYVIVVATLVSAPVEGKIVLNPSRPAWAALSVTPGLKPTIIANSGGV